ncbi:alpha/beta hydrolase [Mesorhizobium sp. CO1-1-7]|uniref:Putative hydrolase or acyltransferase of alpha/beta superfamily n=1 Tax=Mesorhizobium australicum (strain HAMBI 3006 / LMG 24608 / WSM2073) TaxID=754035 RepID=L0KP47_MESAW|nr:MULTISPECIES: alpha/beta hydrolase [Mesorhizobium]AGB47212.1 putative hydrolase or acyltransferase of alpha/beta superfamily [Mesorhizobium australicum WSM2073]MBZ9694714.1 alpha/beta hydrolase [Mesorhizobium sp. CO1-1-9]MBZ9744742.1 alpha/beta hydrolase [Mesorhizobium sp. CO1-1-7]MBZ9977788.1 alpha/beta hydrolase [Mesorhizobium sp. BR-1-1-10]TPK07523.1 alpha/beta hydrolase [Mesorhizobium sp. B2-5-7]
MSSNPGFSDFFYAAPDGLRLHARVYGEANSAHWPVVCLPGLTRNARDFHELALYLSTRSAFARKVIAFDYRGRGQSAYDPDVSHYNVGVEAGDILAGLTALGIKQAAFIGTSRGGLIIHVLGAMQPAALKAIVLNDIGPVIEPAGLDHIRAYLDPTPRPKSRAETVDALRDTHSSDFPALASADWERMASALYRETDQGLMPDFDPRLVETLAALDLSKKLPDLWAQFEALAVMPMLVIRGASSRLFSVETLEEMKKRHPNLEAITVEGQGHAPFLETGSLPVAVAAFLDRAERQISGK